jgi:hypothetical protein
VPEPSDLAATLRRFLANPKVKVGTVPVEVLPHDFLTEVASALEQGTAPRYIKAVKDHHDLCVALIRSIADRGTPADQLQAIANSMSFVEHWDHEVAVLLEQARTAVSQPSPRPAAGPTLEAS